MFKERIQEIFEFTKSQSPYRKANKGWINKDIFLDLRPSADSLAQKNEAIKISVFWSPINTLLSNIGIVIMISSLLVFTSLSFAKGILNFSLPKSDLINAIVKVDDNNILKITQLNDLDSIDNEIEENIEINELEKINKIGFLDDDNSNSDSEITNTDNNEKEIILKDDQNNMKILKNKESKSNFI